MTIEKTFEWLFKRFQMPNIKPCAFDLECLKFLAEWVNREKEAELNGNLLFAKLYCHVFIQEINFYKDFEFAQRKMADYLKADINSHYDKFTNELNRFEFNRYLTSKGIDVTKINYSESKIEEEAEILKNIETEFLQKMETWKTEQVYKSLNNQITESINRFKNLP